MSGCERLTPPQPRKVAVAPAITPDGRVLAVANADADSLTLLDTAMLAVLAEVSVGRSPRAVAIDAAGERASVTGRGDDSLAVDIRS